MRAGLVGPSYQERSLNFDAQRMINMFPTLDESKGGKDVAALYGTPGLLDFATIGDGPIRGEFASTNGRAFVVSGTGLYEVLIDGVSLLLGTILTDTTYCTIEENPTQLAVCDGYNLYILTYSTNVFAQVTDADYQNLGTIAFQDGYIIGNKLGSGQFYISGLNDATSWNALDFATAESSPDNLVRVFSAYGQLWLLGERSVEVWYNSGDVDFTFSRVEGAKMQVGCASAYSLVAMDNTIFWLGRDDKGTGVVYRAQGYTAARISTHAIEYALNQVDDFSLVRGYAYQQDGHLFYVLTGGSLDSTFVYDAATRLWHERATLEDDGTLSTHRAATSMFVFGKHIVGDRTLGKLYEMSLDYYSDAGDPILRQRTFTHIYNEGERFRIKSLQVDFEGGVGLTSGQGSNPLAWLEVSKDLGHTWSSEYSTSIGAKGQYKTRAVWRRLGYGDAMTFRVSITDPVKIAICGSYFQ